MNFHTTTRAATLVLLGLASLGAQAASENLAADNGSFITAQDVNGFGSEQTIHVFGLRGDVDFFGTTIFDNSDADFYSFELAANQTVTLSVDTPEGPRRGNDPVVGLFSTDGLLLISDDDGGPGFDSSLSYDITAAGIYFAAVSGFDDFNFNGISDTFEFEPDGNPVPSTGYQYNLTISSAASPVPVPAAAWLLSSALLGLAVRKRKIG